MYESPSRLRVFSLLALLASVGCDSPMLGPAPVKLNALTLRPSPLMVTAVVATVDCSGAALAFQVAYRASGDSGATPRTAASGCPDVVDVLGLLPATTYTTTAKIWGASGDSAIINGPDITTAAIPSDLPAVTTQTFGMPPSGLTAFAVIVPSRTHGYALIVDSIGRIRWYMTLDRFITDLEPQPNGHYALSLGAFDPFVGSSSSINSEYDELDIAGRTVRRWATTGGYFTDNHEFRLTPSGTGLLLGLHPQSMDLTTFGGSATATVVGNVLQEVDSVGRVLFSWSAFDHFSITDIDPSVSLTSSPVDWNHGNAVEIDHDGNYLLSFRSLSEVTKIDSRTGAVIWRFGGVANQFQFLGDPLQFSFQHGIRRLANGHVILFDNGNTHNPPFSRAVEYQLDEVARTATAVWSYRPAPDLYSAALGLAQRLSNGNTVVTFGLLGTVHEVTPTSQLAWQMTLPPNFFIYRAYRIQSLYDPSLE